MLWLCSLASRFSDVCMHRKHPGRLGDARAALIGSGALTDLATSITAWSRLTFTSSAARSVPTAAIGGWQVALDQVSASVPGLVDPGCSAASPACLVFLDTGNPLVSVPTSVFNNIVALTGATAVPLGPGVPTGSKQLPSCNLAGLPTIAFHIGGRAFPLTPQQYTYKVEV